MKITVVLERPTQFDVPLFRHAAASSSHDLRVLYTSPSAALPAHDPELGRPVTWEDDPLAGYAHAVAPRGDVGAWLKVELAAPRDLVVVNGYTRHVYLRANRMARRAGSPTALRLDSVLFDEGTRPRRIAKRAVFRLAVRRLFDMFLGAGSLTLEYLQALGVPASRRGLFPYAADVEGIRRRLGGPLARQEVRQRLGIPADAQVVTAVAKLHPRETPADLLAAWPLLAGRSERPRWLLLIGDGPDRDVLAERLRNEMHARVVMPGYVPYSDLPRHYQATDVFVHAPHTERWGVSVAEALACGVPVVASTRVGAAADLLIEENGRVFPAGDPTALASAVETMLQMPRERVVASSASLLMRWGVERSWEHLLDAAGRARASET